MNIAIIGPSGVGKGTHASHLCAKFELRHVAVGDVFRANLKNRTALGILARKYMEQGELVPDEVVDAMLEEWTNRLPGDRGTLIDGFPRTAGQARFLDELLRRYHRTLDAVIYLHVDDEEIVLRLSGRFICRNCQKPYHQQENPPAVYGVCDECGGELYHRPDDSTDVVRARLRMFHRTTSAVLDHYRAAQKLVIVPGGDSLLEVQSRLELTLTAVRSGKIVFASARDVAALPRPAVAAATPVHLARQTLDFVLLGAPGSGKGTQAEVLCARLRLPHIATGDLFRDNLRRETKLGKLAKTYMDRGELVPDDVTDAMVEDRLAQPDVVDGFVLDGFPRTLHQAHALMEMMSRHRRRLTAVLYIKVADEAIVGRLSGRLVCEKCQAPYHTHFKAPKAAGKCDHCGGTLYQRPDDSSSTVRARLATFHRQTEPLIEFYRHATLLHEIAGERDVQAVAAETLKTVRRIALVAESDIIASAP
ncbi:MAG: adenylate kinase [Opitutaceae bacterium]|nr:adenylate kinase [Opitutaceae bacterium]